MTILGIDPGTQQMGYAIIRIAGSSVKVEKLDTLKLTKEKDIYKRLEIIHATIISLIAAYHPTDFAIEAPFFGKNVQSMLKLGRAQGVAIAAAMQYGISVTEYAPKKVKQSVTGNGNADKEQVWKMLAQILGLKQKPSSFDATDALSVAYCHYLQATSVLKTSNKKLKGWEDFIAKNAARVKR
ncbi:MAG: crossover junction endodeoxyribonuclease RuvC [Sediminibacterium sp.]